MIHEEKFTSVEMWWFRQPEKRDGGARVVSKSNQSYQKYM